ncbi:hypothetical protein MLD38_025541 [Melastoma candidum]|uniref:Uncharacterized protein n=1 Tax=Melastoma candidum TaxID=119954 RepID=A0ACB9NWM7_9MYRT|nr:hypothetical protein MLD38_025541 [Melastoma candidum]
MPLFLRVDGDKLSSVFVSHLLEKRAKVCLVIINSNSCTNTILRTVVEKLKLPIKAHPHRYRLQWLNKESDVRVTHRARVPFSIGKNYKDEVICDVISMDACHLLLGRPWQYD